MTNTAFIAQKRAKELLADGTVKRVLGWKKGELYSDRVPAVFTSAEEIDELVIDEFCAANLSKYLIDIKEEGKTLALLKPCDTYSLNQLVKEHRVNRDNVYVLGIPCDGKLDPYLIRSVSDSVIDVEVNGTNVLLKTLDGDATAKKEYVLLEKCRACKGKKHMCFDELVDPDAEREEDNDRFACVEKVEAMTAEERFAFFKSELSRCVRCNACRNVCPACSCIECVFDDPRSGVSSKASHDDFEDQLYHIIRAYHVAGRCTDCGECSRVCPERIPLHLINRKLIKDMNELYGEYTAGADDTTVPPLTSYSKDDAEPNVVSDREGK